MFKNLVNLYDFVDVLRYVRVHGLKRVLRRLRIKRDEAVQAAWGEIEAPPIHWWDIPAVRKRWNRLVAGDPDIDYREYLTNKYLKGYDEMYGLSLGCGTGSKELIWARLCKFSMLDAYDISKPRIDVARETAKACGVRNVRYQVADVNKIDFPEEKYDVVLAEGSMHHFPDLENLFSKIHRTLKPTGYFILNDFVGPTRFQWTDRQLEVINGVLAILPRKYRMRWPDRSVKSKIHRPGRLRMMLSDPSEAVESSKVLPLLRRYFEVVEMKGLGGTILHMLFSDIAMNFLSDDEESRGLLEMCFLIEDTLIKIGDISDDFVLAVCKRK